VLDPADRAGYKNFYLDRLQKLVLEPELRRFRPEAVLDVGCGVGRLSAWVAERFGARVRAVDASPAMIEAARRRHGSSSPVSFELFDGRRLGGEPGGVDVALAVYALGAIESDAALADLLADVRRLLRPGGGALVYDHAAEGREKLLRSPEGGFYWLNRTPEQYRRLFEAAGFRLEVARAVAAPQQGLMIRAHHRGLLPGRAFVLLPWLVRLDRLYAARRRPRRRDDFDLLLVFVAT